MAPSRAPWKLLAREEWAIVLLLGATYAANGYDSGLLTMALPQIQTGLEVSERDLGGFVAVIRLGIVPAFALALFADRVGRRRMLLVTVLGFALCSLASAFARDAREFAALQLVARSFAIAEEMVAVVLLAELVSARVRGFAVGILAALEDLGHGLAAMAFGALGGGADGWRLLYAIGGLPLLLVAWLRRRLPESARFQAEQRERPPGTHALAPLAQLLREHPRRLSALVVATAPFSFAASAALAFVSKYLQEQHAYAPHEVSFLIVGAGALLLPASLAVGALADRIGRKRMLAMLLLIHALGGALFYNAAGPALPAAWFLMMVGFAGCEVLFAALGAELFPTAQRATASGVRAIALAGGGALGLASEGLLFERTGSHAAAITGMLMAPLLSAVVVLAFLPETAARELEETSRNDEADRGAST